MTFKLPQDFTWVEGKAPVPIPETKQAQKRYEVGIATPEKKFLNEYTRRRIAFLKAEAFAALDHSKVFYVLDRQAQAGTAQLYTVFFSDLTKRVVITVVRHAH